MKTITYNNNTIEYYDYYLTSNSCVFTFLNVESDKIQKLFGSDIVSSILFADDEINIKQEVTIGMKIKSIKTEMGSIVHKSHEIIKASYYTEEQVVDANTGKPIIGDDGLPMVNTVFHPAEIKTTTSEETGEIITVTLERPSIYESIDNINKTVQKQNVSFNVAKIVAQSFDDEQALTVKGIYPTFDDLVAQNYTAGNIGYKFTYNDELYKTAQKNLTFQGQYVPGQGTESLYTHINETHTGSLEDPIPAFANMEYFQGKYYIENGVIYLCNSELAKDGIVLQFTPSDLVGTYFEKVESDV